MRRYGTFLVAVVAGALLASFAVAQPPEGPRGRRAGREGLRDRREQGRRGLEGRGEQPGAAEAWRHGRGFVMGYLRDNEQFIAEMEKHRTNLREIGDDLRELRQRIRERLADPDLTPEERRRIIERGKVETAKLLTKIVDEVLRHRHVVSRIIKAEKENIVNEAVERIFSPRRRRPRPDRVEPNVEGERGPTRPRGPYRREGKRPVFELDEPLLVQPN